MSSAGKIARVVLSVALAYGLFRLLVVRSGGSERPLGLLAMGLIAVAFQLAAVVYRRLRPQGR